MSSPTPVAWKKFKRMIWSHYHAHRRDMPWRRDTSLYSVIVSEIMLQQTQVSRVALKFASWMKRFPDWQSLAKAPTRDVLQEWSGLGYNRRALYLKRIAEAIMSDPGYTILRKQPGKLTRADTAERDGASIAAGQQAGTRVGEGHVSPAALRMLPGIGPNTAGSIMAFAWNLPQPFIETNIRSVFIDLFFKGSKRKVTDAEIMLLIEKALEDATIRKNPREWYWALMDYGAFLKQRERSRKQEERSGHRSTHHIRQKPFKGSNRELRSKILKAVLKEPADAAVLGRRFGKKNVIDLIREGFMVKKGAVLHIA